MEQRGGGILITGGTGFLGRALARRLLAEQVGPVNAKVPRWQRICIYSRGEHAQAAMFKELREDERLRMFVGDVRDRERLFWAMRSVDVVIHAAALKRIEVGHYNPGEMVKTNIQGAMNVVEAAIAAGVERAVLVSTDKAHQPVSPYGLSKAMAEAIFLAGNNIAGANGPSFGVCRYGNVAGSTGSVIPLWREILANAQPGEGATKVLPVTDPEATRFWMTIGEACDLVLSAVSGKVTERTSAMLIPTLRAFDLGTLARAMGADAIKLTGLKHWEKKHESLRDGDTSDAAPRMTFEELQQELKHV